MSVEQVIGIVGKLEIEFTGTPGVAALAAAIAEALELDVQFVVVFLELTDWEALAFVAAKRSPPLLVCACKHSI